jgi:hypothetical protein
VRQPTSGIDSHLMVVLGDHFGVGQRWKDREADYACRTMRLFLDSGYIAQTYLERVKNIYTDSPGVAPDKIAPTIGQNS